MIGNMLRERDNQYVASKDNAGTWRILDTWHTELGTLAPDDDIPDDNPAVTLLTEGAFIALVKEASRLGVLQNSSFNSDVEAGELSMEISEMEEKVVKYEQEISNLKHHPVRSEGFALKEKAMEAILRLNSIAEIETLIKDN